MPRKCHSSRLTVLVPLTQRQQGCFPHLIPTYSKIQQQSARADLVGMDDLSSPMQNCQPLWRVVPEGCLVHLLYSSARELVLAGAIFWLSWRIGWESAPIFAGYFRS